MRITTASRARGPGSGFRPRRPKRASAAGRPRSRPGPSWPGPARPFLARPVTARPGPALPGPTRPVPSRPGPSRPGPARPVPARPGPATPLQRVSDECGPPPASPFPACARLLRPQNRTCGARGTVQAARSEAPPARTHPPRGPESAGDAPAAPHTLLYTTHTHTHTHTHTYTQIPPWRRGPCS